MACSSSCRTQDHASWGECVRAKGLLVGQVDTSVSARTNSELRAYAAARREGIQPASTSARDVQRAVVASQNAGRAFNAGVSDTTGGL